jgi:tryptophan synthase alpha chain
VSLLTERFRLIRREEGRALLIPYLTAGDPGLAETIKYAEALAEGGADLLELGVPFSDPLADGPVIQRAVARALAAGTTVADVLACVRTIHERTGLPLVLMTYLNPVLRFGYSEFVQEAAAVGVAGLLVTDMPVEEADPYLPALKEAGIGSVFLVAPTSGNERIQAAARRTTGFLYCVSRLGVTGPRRELGGMFQSVVARIRESTDLPVGLGFGISSSAHVREAGAIADGVIVGSSLVRLAADAPSPEAAAHSLREKAREYRRALAKASSPL